MHASFIHVAGQDILNKQTERWMPGVSSFWETLRFYFAVDNAFVYKKIQLLLVPLRHKQWARHLSDENTSDPVDYTYLLFLLPPM
jgi:protein transport protein YIF1